MVTEIVFNIMVQVVYFLMFFTYIYIYIFIDTTQIKLSKNIKKTLI